MTNQNFPRRLLDDAIDRAVRELVHGDPRPGLRRRVLDRLHEPARTAWWPKLLIPASALAAIIVAVMWLRPVPQTPQSIVASNPSPTIAPAAAPAPSPVQPPKPATDRPVRQALRQFQFGPRTDRVSATSMTTRGPVTELPGATDPFADSGPAPIAIEPLRAPAEIVVPPITFSRIDAVAPSGSR